MVRKGLLIWSIVMLLGMVVSGCSSSAEVAAPITAGENTEAEQEIEKDGKSEETQEEISEESIGDIFTIGFVQGGEESDRQKADTMRYREIFCKENGYELELVDCGSDSEKQKEAIRDFIARQLDYIILVPAEKKGWDDVLKEAQYAGIPVIIAGYEVDADASRYDTWVGVDGKIQGVNAGKWLAEHLKNKEANIVILENAIDPSVGEKRKKGLKEVGKGQEGWKIIASKAGEDTKEDGKKAMESLIASYQGKFNVLVCQGDEQAMGAMEAMEEAGMSYGADGEIIVISFGGTKKGLEAVLAGKISCLMGGSPTQAEKVEEIIGKMRSGETYEARESTGDQVFVAPGMENTNATAVTEEIITQWE